MTLQYETRVYDLIGCRLQACHLMQHESNPKLLQELVKEYQACL